MKVDIGFLTIRAKIILSFGLAAAIVIGLGLFAVDRLSTVNGAAAEIRDHYLQSTANSEALISAVKDIRTGQLHYLVLEPGQDRAELGQTLPERIKAVEALRQAYERFIDVGTERSLIGTYDREWATYRDLFLKTIALIDEGKRDAAIALADRGANAAYDATLDALSKLVDDNVAEGKKKADQSAAVYGSAKRLILSVIGIAVLLSALLGGLIVRGVSAPINRMTAVMKRLAAHDLAVEINGTGRRDEIGAMADAVAVFKDSMIEADRLEATQQAERAAKASRQAGVEAATLDFVQAMDRIVASVNGAAVQLRGNAQGLSATAEETTRQSSAVASAADQASANVQTVATAADELSASITEISRQVQQAATVADTAVAEADSTNDTIRGLATSAQKIGAVVKLISDIASQTNLLALNATIEAARAGEHGKGFAVVATEVKSLAAQTAKATEEIEAQVGAIQIETERSVTAITGISGTISDISEITSSVAAAVQQQGAATDEIARNVQEAASGTTEVSSNIVNVTRSAAETGRSAGEMLGAADDLLGQAGLLKQHVDEFLQRIRTA